ncbi:MAG TPA: apolipoprotein N-acyltransferase [Candidatus Acidoferrales bacterium]|nr:apolipoprotein N-acyltransferase [Candidatus Acidoferrales bacterium]
MRGIAKQALRPLAAGVSGAGLVLAFAPWEWAALAPICLWAFVALTGGCSARRAFAVGYAFGLGQFGFGVSWVFVSIYEHGNAGLPLAALLTAMLVGFLAFIPALVAAITTVLGRPVPTRRLWVFPAAWVTGEWVRSWIFTGFPWLAIGYTQSDGSLAGYAPVFGVLGIGAVLAGTATALEFIRTTASGRGRGLALAILLGVWTCGAALRAVSWTHPEGPPLAVALVQGNVPQENKWDARRADEILARYAELTQPLLGTSLIVWPEAALPRVYHELAGTYLTQLQVAAAATGSEILLGLLRFDPQRRVYLNSVLLLGLDRQFYDKRHLVPFGEYFPVPDLVRRWMQVLEMPYSDLGAGSPQPDLLRTHGLPLATFICYEVVFGNEVIRDLPAARLLVNVSNDAWFGRSFAPHQHFQIARLRAIETGRDLVRATNTGVTALVDATGRVRARLPSFEVGVLRGEIQPRVGATPYVRWGDLPVLVWMAVTLTLATGLRLRRR